MKREYKLANKQRDAGVDEDEEDDEEEDLAKVKAKRRMEKMIRNREGNDAYESDDDENPYLSSVRSPPCFQNFDAHRIPGGGGGGGRATCAHWPCHSTPTTAGRPTQYPKALDQQASSAWLQLENYVACYFTKPGWSFPGCKARDEPQGAEGKSSG